MAEPIPAADIPTAIFDPKKFLTEHWEELVMLSNNHLPLLLTLLILLSGIVWAFAMLFYRKRIGDLEERIRLRDDEIKTLRDSNKNSGASSTVSPSLLPPKPRQLHLEFLDDLIDYSNSNVFDVVVSVHNPTESTIPGVSVCIESIWNLDEPDDSDIARLLPIFRNLHLPLRDHHTTPPRGEIDIHPNTPPVVFKLVTLQRDLPQQKQGGEILLHHTQWQVEKDAPSFNSPYPRPHGALPLGRYRVRLRAQGRDVPAVLLTIEFENVPGHAKAWAV